MRMQYIPLEKPQYACVQIFYISWYNLSTVIHFHTNYLL